MSIAFHKAALAAVSLAALTVPAVATAAETLQVVSGPAGTRKVTVSAADPIGQSFSAFTDTISSIGFQFSTLNPTAANTSLTLSLFAGETLSGTSLFTQSFTLPSSITSRDTSAWVDIALPNLAVTMGGFYTAVLTATSDRAALLVGPDYNVSTGQFSGGDAYAGGKLLTNWTGIYANCKGAANNCDANFRVTGDLNAAAVPEPATWALMLLGFGAVGAALRRRPAVAVKALA
ncbi:MAG: hypothetical protein B7Z08_00795 [Sphingomonadales bacterium 32-68-7]|nr:MAG: hypothetical protein B7Z33_12770 [Sphingomonadales bacterium 12-68-11]OYX10466.1 MAG: hypothetical protein B7Z08_00795 [Sphingomonadales bacterium 32-68-7]